MQWSSFVLIGPAPRGDSLIQSGPTPTIILDMPLFSVSNKPVIICCSGQLGHACNDFDLNVWQWLIRRALCLVFLVAQFIELDVPSPVDYAGTCLSSNWRSRLQKSQELFCKNVSLDPSQYLTVAWWRPRLPHSNVTFFLNVLKTWLAFVGILWHSCRENRRGCNGMRPGWNWGSKAPCLTNEDCRWPA